MDIDDAAEQKDDDPEDADDPTLLPLSTKPIVVSSSHAVPSTATSSTPGAAVQNNQIWQALRDSVMDVCGDVGWGKVASSMQGQSLPPFIFSSFSIPDVGLIVKYYSPTTSLCIIRVAREHVRTAWTGLTFINAIGGQPVIPRVVAVSGSSPRPFLSYQKTVC
jgi:ribonuclease P/MRP protein subunit POP5